MIEKLIDVFMHLDRHIENRDEYGICYTSDFVEAVETVLQILKNGVTVQKWISVKERMPRNDTYILVSTDCVVIPAYWHNDRFYSFTAIGIATVGGVTHWMPLPEPQKGE